MIQKDDNKMHIVVSKLEMWAARVIVLAILGLSSWLVTDYHSSQVMISGEIAAVKKELEDTKPKDILTALNNSNKDTHSKIDGLKEQVLSKEDVRSIIMDHSPWPLVEKDWETWRLRIEKDLIQIRQQLNEIQKEEERK